MRTLLKALPFAAALLLAAACGGQQDNGIASLHSPAPSSSASSDVPTDPHQKALAFAKCMRDHGVDMPDPKPDLNGGIQALPGIKPGEEDKVNGALEACKKYSPVADIDPNDPKVKAKQAAFAKCMRDHGVDLPDPGAGGQAATIDTGDAKTAAALKTCSK